MGVVDVETDEKVALLAGAGKLPLEFARAAKRSGFCVTAVAIDPDVDPRLKNEVTRFVHVPLTQWGRVIHELQLSGSRHVFVFGWVSKTVLFAEASWDDRFRRVVTQAQDGSNAELLSVFAADLAQEGLHICEQPSLLPELFPGPGVLTRRSPNEQEWRDIAFGFHMAKSTSALDIGQTVVVKDKVVLAVEAMEGTDATIARGGRLGQGGAVAVKVAHPQQDLRFDMPTIGPSTIAAMASSGVTVLAFEAGRTFVVDRERVVQDADGAGIAVVAWHPEATGERGGTTCG